MIDKRVIVADFINQTIYRITKQQQELRQELRQELEQESLFLRILFTLLNPTYAVGAMK